jgi:predicted DNA-binding transcriptional regulator YafY
MRDGEELKVLYQSMRRPAPSTRWIAPHALAYDGLRWHVRAWCHENSDFRDFVISRIQRVKSSRPTTAVASTDTWWHTLVDIVVKPRAELTQAQRSAIEVDFGMTAGRLKLSCRKALAFYLLRQLQLDRPAAQPPAAQPLELMNRDELSEVIAAAYKSPQVPLRPRRLETTNERA